MPERAMPMYRAVFLFGAGASYGAGGVSPSAPPLGDGLFDILVRQYPSAWGGLGPPVARKFREEGFENGMAWVWRNMPSAPQILQKCLGHFFCLFGIEDVNANAYVRLLRQIAPVCDVAPIALATLNYDMIMEEAASHVGLTWNYGDTLAEHNRALIVKPHGSCNFISKEIQIQHGSGHVGIDTGVGVDGNLKALRRREAFTYCSDPNNGLYPAIVAFMEGKPTQVCHTALRDMQEAFNSAVLTAERVAVVGVNPHVADQHVWDCLAETSADVAFCGDEHAFYEWSTNNRGTRPTRYLGPYFGDAVGALAKFVQ